MSTKTHTNRFRVTNSRGEQVTLKREAKDCPACQPKCRTCGQPFTTSTALSPLEERSFCTQACADFYNKEFYQNDRKAMERAYNATPKQLGEAALRAAKASSPRADRQTTNGGNKHDFSRRTNRSNSR